MGGEELHVLEGDVSSDEQEKVDMDRVKRAVEELAEHFDSVQVFCTRKEPLGSEAEGGTVNVAYGSGDWFARYGVVRMWVVKQENPRRED